MFSGYRAEGKGGCYTFFVENVRSCGGVSAALSSCKGKGGLSVCAKTGETPVWGKQREVTLQASVLIVLLEVIDSSGFYVILYTW